MTIPDPKITENIEWLTHVRKQVESLRFGIVQITVHEGRVVQIERTERTRLGPASWSQGPERVGA
jgi:hypothetical protein